jgi:hypothetical protein
MHKDCPKCGLVNLPSASRCDCGYDFETGRVSPSVVKPKREPSGAAALAGVLLVILGVLALGVGGLTAQQAQNAGEAVGAFLPGLLLLILGLWLRQRGTGRKGEGD